MALPFGHKCGETELRCFDCRKPICRDCMIELPKSLVCRSCKPRAAGKSVKVQVNDLVKLEAASVFYSFIAFAALGYAQNAGAGQLVWLFAALAGVFIAESLNNLPGAGMGRRGQLFVVCGGVAFGFILGSGFRAIMAGRWESLAVEIFASIISLIIVVLAILFRFRTR